LRFPHLPDRGLGLPDRRSPGARADRSPFPSRRPMERPSRSTISSFS
jgi:hypothetical protein